MNLLGTIVNGGNLVGTIITPAFMGCAKVDEVLQTMTAQGEARFMTQNAMRRCMLKDDGTVNYYLDGHNKTGVSPTISGVSETASDILKLKDTGAFASVVSGQYVKNITSGRYHKILNVDNANEVSLLFDLQTTDGNWGDADGTAAGKLVDSGADFAAAGVLPNDVAFNRTDDVFAKITAVGTTTVDLDSDIFVSGEAYSIISDNFTAGDPYEVQTAVFEDSDGQVMVEIPKFYYQYLHSGDLFTYNISPIELTGYIVHPAFTPGGIEKDLIYVGAFENTYESYYQGVNAFLSSEPGVIVNGSQAGLQPITRGRRWVVRQCTVARGAGWHLMDLYTHHAIQLLYMAEYGSFDSQTEIGQGFTDWLGDHSDALAYNNRYGSIHTGWSLKDGNLTANRTKGAGVIGSYMSYRGIENLYGSLNCMIDGINIMPDSKVYLCNTPASYADATITGDYSFSGLTLSIQNNEIGTYQDNAYMFALATAGSLIPDLYKHSTGEEKVFIVSGTTGYNLLAGVFTFSATTAVTDRAEHNAFRVVYR